MQHACHASCQADGLPTSTPAVIMPAMSHDTSNDAPRRIPVHEAAPLLGISENAVRARLRRGTLVGVKHGTSWHVLLRDSDIPVIDADAPRDVPRDAPSHTTARNAAHDHRDEEIRYLREQLDRALRQLESERERADVLMREALGRIEALTAGEPRQDAAVSTQEAPGEEHAGAVDYEASAPWWRRWWRSLRTGS